MRRSGRTVATNRWSKRLHSSSASEEDDGDTNSAGASTKRVSKRRRKEEEDFNPSEMDTSDESQTSGESSADDMPVASRRRRPGRMAVNSDVDGDVSDPFDGFGSDDNEPQENDRDVNEPHPNEGNVSDDFNIPEHDQNQNQPNKRPLWMTVANEQVINSICREHFEFLVNHIFLPKRIRVDLFREDPKRDMERVLDLVVETMRNFGTKLERHLPKIFSQLSLLYKRGYSNDLITPSKIYYQISQLMHGQMFVIYLHEQNCGFIAYKPRRGQNAQERIVSTFQASLPNEIITENKGDIQVEYPSQSINVPNNVVSSSQFALILSRLCDTTYKVTPPNNRKATPKGEIEEVQSDCLVSEWLMTCLTNRDSDITSTDEFPRITKKMRDEVIKTAGDGQFRRSGLWTATKVFLQLALQNEYGERQGKVYYKTILLQLMCNLSRIWLRKEITAIDASLALQMMAKLARRTEKLSAIDDEYLVFTEATKKEVLKTINEIYERIDINFQNQIDVDQIKYPALEDLKIIKFVQLELKTVQEYIRKRVENEHQAPEINNEPRHERIARHRKDTNEFPCFRQLKNANSEDELSILLIDIEQWIETNFNVGSANASRICELATTYGDKAKVFYAGDPIGGSRMILCLLKFIKVLDAKAILAHNLFQEHRPGVDTKIIDELLLPKRSDLVYAMQIRRYFNDRTSESRQFPGLLDEEAVTGRSFAARYAKADTEMQAVRNAILKFGEEARGKKLIDLVSIREEVRTLRDKASKMRCEYIAKVMPNNVAEKIHKPTCKLCKLHKKIDSQTVDMLENPLPNDPDLQNAIVFELNIPDEIVCLRDILHYFRTEFCNGSMVAKQIVGKWADYSRVKTFCENGYRQQRIHLGSSTALFATKSAKHPDAADNEILVENGYNCKYFAMDHKSLNNTNELTTKKFTKFTVESDSLYSCLDWAFNRGHTQNEVLASQNDCPLNLPMTEYIAFGSLRSDGHRLQLRNIYRAIETETLSFESCSVMFLILQSLWEAGPEDDHHEWHRDTHMDLCDPDFALAFLRLLHRYWESQHMNWKQPMKLTLIIIIVSRILEFNSYETVTTPAFQLLVQCRDTSRNWMAAIQKAKSDCDCAKIDDITNLRTNLIDAAIACALTFMPYNKDINIFVNSADFDWILAIVVINQNILLSQASVKQMSASRKILLRMVRETGVNIEKEIQALILGEESNLARLVKTQWKMAVEFEFQPWIPMTHAEQVVFTHFIEDHVQIDIIKGTFLVNNNPVARLPEKIHNHIQYQRLFGDTVFDVQPTGQNCFYTNDVYDGSRYLFEMEETTEDDVPKSELIIKEHRETGDIFQLIPHSCFADEIPFLLVENYSHWWNQQAEIIEFRPKEFKPREFCNPNRVSYEINLYLNELMEMKTKRKFIDIISPTYKKMVEYLNRLEDSKYIHIFMDDVSIDKALIELPRMRLHFTFDIKRPKDLLSIEFEGMRVSRQQKFGTLIGLKNGLLLEDKNEIEQQILIMPHGTIETSLSNIKSITEIKTVSLREPAFFEYTVDKRCQYIKAKNNITAWLYMAHLHAVTTHLLPDPFTGMTGTERALQILQSACVWSSAPYDTESIITLTHIAKLSPKRQFVPEKTKQAQFITFPDFLTDVGASDSFHIIVDKLIKDSEKLGFLYSKFKHTELGAGSVFLNERAYWRHLHYMPNTKIKQKMFIKAPSDNHRYTRVLENVEAINDMRKIAALNYSNEFNLPNNVTECLLKLMTAAALKEVNGVKSQTFDNVLDSCLNKELRDIWIDLYNSIRTQQIKYNQRVFILNLLLYCGSSMESVLILQAIATNQAQFNVELLRPPVIGSYVKPSEYEFNEKWVIARFKSNSVGENRFARDPTDVGTYKSLLNAQCRLLGKRAAKIWPTPVIRAVDLQEVASTTIRVSGALDKINKCVRNWHDNRQLRHFLMRVGDKCGQFRVENDMPMPIQWNYPPHQFKDSRKYRIDFNEMMCEQLSNAEYAQILRYSKKLFEDGLETDTAVEIRKQMVKYPKSEKNADQIDNLLEMFYMLWKSFQKASIPDRCQHLVKSGLYPRIVPTNIMPLILKSNNSQQKYLIGAICVSLTIVQKAKRLAKLENLLPQSEVAYKREIQTILHDDWSPNEYPECLLFEIENDLAIRRIQMKVAQQMIEPAGGGHSVMQLNMGEGKTAVIVPIVAAILADKSQLCQITVLRPLFQTNLRSLRQSLGGMLNRRIYIFPCRRNCGIDEKGAETIQKSYEKCMKTGGVVMTLPEHQLSFQLKIYETARKCNVELSKLLLNTFEWLNKHVRSVMDESDAILQPKYQLVYTIGEELPLDGANLRWTILQDLLKCIPQHMLELWQKYGNQKIEFDEGYRQRERLGSEAFVPCRILDPTVYEELIQRICDDFVQGKTRIQFTDLRHDDWEKLRETILNRRVDDEIARQCLETFDENITAKNTVLILAGLLKYDVLRLVLMKRFRVEYGVNDKSNKRMAVPFKAKDVAAEMTEFGQPDVAIAFTHLSYYYSGLTDKQLFEAFDRLSNMTNPEVHFDLWIKPIDAQIDPSIRNYNGINLMDARQRDELLFPVMRFNMYVIDFWLSFCVLQRESRIYTAKMMCTSWDVCSENMRRTVTGFSGTNDTKLLLPMQIRQNDLEELEDTNQRVRNYLLLPKNNNYKSLPPCVSGTEIIRQLLANNISVLLDSGALMLELNNREVAKQWLKHALDTHFDAALFFNECDEIMVIDRNGFEAVFEFSPYKERLARCLVYLDDAHTRGTDLRFPRQTRACVTLCGGITRDKTVQACMRMRQLGHDHTIAFWASDEADNSIRVLRKKNKDELVTAEDVVEWIQANSEKFEKDGLVHWAVAGVNYCQKVAAHRSKPDNLVALSNMCSEDEVLHLIDMYGLKKEVLYTKIVRHQFEKLLAVHTKDETRTWITMMKNDILEKLENNIPQVMRFTQLLDEEQEKELEKLKEEERENCRPSKAVAQKAVINENVTKFIHRGSNDMLDGLIRHNAIVSVSESLVNTSLWKICQPTAWGKEIYATKDFMNVIENKANDKLDEYLRPVWWIVSSATDNQQIAKKLLLVSPFEANEYMPMFRSNRTMTTLHMFAAKLNMQQDTFLENMSLQIPTLAGVRVDKRLKSELYLYSGTTYFSNTIEQEAYCHLLGLIPRPRSAKHTEAFENGMITAIGFVPPQYRNDDISREILENCRFLNCPDQLVIKMIERRNAILPRSSHVSLIVTEAKKPFI